MRKRRTALFVTVFFLISTLLNMAVPGFVQTAYAKNETSSYTITCNQSDIEVGDIYTFTLRGINIEEMYAYDARINFDSTKAEFLIDECTTSIRGFFYPKLALDNNNQVALIFTLLGDAKPIAGDKDLCTFAFQAKEAGDVTFTMDSIQIVDDMLSDNKIRENLPSVTITQLSAETPPPPTVSGVTVSPSTANVQKGNKQTFSAEVTGENNPVQTVTWTVEDNESADTEIAEDGELTIGSDETAEELTVRATSTVDTTKSGTAKVTVTTPIPTVSGVTVSPSTVTLKKGKKQLFRAIVVGEYNPAQTVTWKVEDQTSKVTSITPEGELKIGYDETSKELTVRATSTVDTTKSGTATVTVTDQLIPSFTISANQSEVKVGDTYSFTLNATGLDEMYSYDARITFDSSKADFDIVSTNTSIRGFFYPKLANNDVNEAALIFTLLGEATPLSGSKELCTFYFTAKEAGDISFIMKSIHIVDDDLYDFKLTKDLPSVTITQQAIAPPPPTVTSVTVTPKTAGVQRGNKQSFAATISGNNNPAQTVTWKVEGNHSDDTVISKTGELTVGNNETATELTVRATSTVDNTKSGTATVTVTSPTIPEEGFHVSEISDYTYTGKAIKPVVEVYDGANLLTLNKDYKVSYKNNTNVYTGNDHKKKPQVTVTGIGNYSGTETICFKISPKNLADDDVRIDDIYTVSNGKEQKILPTVYWDTKKLVYNKSEAKSDYKVIFPKGNYKAAGEHVITVEGIRNYSGSKTYRLIITGGKLIRKATVKITSSMPYNDGAAVIPKVLTVKMGKVTLKENRDYKVAYENNTQVGTATAIISGMGAYAGTKKVSYKITGKKLSSAKITGIKNAEYTGDPILQSYQITYGRNKEALQLHDDYELEYRKNTNAGTATMIFTGIGGYTGTVKKTFQISKYSIKNNTKGYFQNDSTNISVQYEKGGAKPNVRVTFRGSLLEKGKDYNLSYKNNTVIHDGIKTKKIPTITISGKGNFKDAVTKTFAITAGNLQADGVRIKANDVVYSNKKNAYKSTPVVTDINGKRLTAGVDYSKAYEYRYNNAGGVIIGTNEKPAAGSVIYVKVTGQNNYAGSSIGTTYRIVGKSISKATVKVKVQTYTGEPITITKDDITSIQIGKKVLSKDNYEIIPDTYVNNIKKGTAKVTIRGLGEYGQEKVISFKIKSAGF